MSLDGSCISFVKEPITAKGRDSQIVVTLFKWLMQRQSPIYDGGQCNDFISLIVLLVLYGVSENQGFVFVRY